MTSRVVSLIDMDCFYVQVEQKLNQQLVGKPCAVVQYNNYRGGGLIAVNYEARARGVKRHMRGSDAQRVCPELYLARVPELNGKADLTRYRSAGHEVIQVLNSFARCVERASVDEAYVDLTEEVDLRLLVCDIDTLSTKQLQSTFVVGIDDSDEEAHKKLMEAWPQSCSAHSLGECSADRKLLVGALLVEEIRAAILSKTGYKCSAGIAHNKVLAKLACGMHKPNRQTILSQVAVPHLFSTLPLKNVRLLGGKLGDSLEETLRCKTMGDVGRFTEPELRKHFGDKTGSWLFLLAQGVDNEPVTARSLPKSIGCSKNFNGRSALSSVKDIRYWLLQFGNELQERLMHDRDSNHRVATSLTVSVRLQTDSFSGVSRTCALSSYSAERIAQNAFKALSKLNTAATSDADMWHPHILSLGISASKFQDLDNKSANCMANFLRSFNKIANGEVDEFGIEESEDAIEVSNSTNENAHSDYEKVWDIDKRAMQKLEDVPPASAEGFLHGRATCTMQDDKGVSAPFLSTSQSAVSTTTRIQQVSSKVAQKTSTAVGIRKFFQQSASEICNTETGQQHTEAQVDVTGLAPEDQVYCDRCCKHVSVWDWLEHQDRHLAVDLSKQLNQVEAVGSSFLSGGTLASGRRALTKKRSRKIVTKSPAHNKKSRSIASFFQ